MQGQMQPLVQMQPMQPMQPQPHVQRQVRMQPEMPPQQPLQLQLQAPVQSGGIMVQLPPGFVLVQPQPNFAPAPVAAPGPLLAFGAPAAQQGCSAVTTAVMCDAPPVQQQACFSMGGGDARSMMAAPAMVGSNATMSPVTSMVPVAQMASWPAGACLAAQESRPIFM
jgi:hypothetical protein